MFNSEHQHLDVLLDLGHPLINRAFDGFVKIGGIGAVHAAAQDSYDFWLQEQANKKSLKNMILSFEFVEPELALEKPWKHMALRAGKEAIQWGLGAGVYTSMTSGMQEMRGAQDWKNALVGGALTGATLSLTQPNISTDHIVRGAIKGGAVATAAGILRGILDYRP